MNLLETMTEARRVSVPLVYITTSDPSACVTKLLPILDQGESVITWTPADGLRPLEAWEGEERSCLATAKILAEANTTTDNTADINQALRAIKNADKDVVFFFYVLSPSAFFQGPRTLQQVWNLRDIFKAKSCMLAFLGPDVSLPPGIANDIIALTEPQPELEDLKKIVKSQHRDLKIHYPDIADLNEETVEKSAMAVLGLPAYSAETSVAMCLREDGIDLTALREQRYDRLDQVKGITVWRGKETFADIGGCDGVKEDLRLVLRSDKRKISAIFYLDELDKMFAGTGGGDLSGMADEYLGLLLSYMQDHEVSGMLFLGLPGTSKTYLSKAMGNEAQRITLSVNLNLMKDHLMGNSEANLHRFFRIATAISGDSSLFVASCNSAARLPTSLLRRFKTGRYFFDLPTREERKLIWNIKLTKYQLQSQELPDDTQWTGAEIEACCERAWLRNISIKDAGRAIIPVAVAAPEELHGLRVAANNRFLNAATGLPYQYAGEEVREKSKQEPTSSRKVRLQ